MPGWIVAVAIASIAATALLTWVLLRINGGSSHGDGGGAGLWIDGDGGQDGGGDGGGGK